jgi:hypothetical protein
MRENGKRRIPQRFLNLVAFQIFAENMLRHFGPQCGKTRKTIVLSYHTAHRDPSNFIADLRPLLRSYINSSSGCVVGLSTRASAFSLRKCFFPAARRCIAYRGAFGGQALPVAVN